MPRDLALDPAASVFEYGAIVSPPRDIGRWADLVRDLVTHLADRFGRDEVRAWAFEVWNEPNMGLFWRGSQADYVALYGAAARAVKAVDPAFRVGGPATAAAGWIDDFLAACAEDDLPLDFISTHSYGVAPMDFRPNTLRAGRPDLPLLWTEWAVSPRHGAAVNDSPWAATMIARAMRSAAGRLDALSYWVASDHFEELGQAPSLFHGGFGLLTIGEPPQARLLGAVDARAAGRGRARRSRSSGDGSGSLVRGLGVARPRWTGRDRRLERDAGPVEGGRRPGAGPVGHPGGEGSRRRAYELRHHRVDADHSNITRVWDAPRPAGLAG